MNLDKILYCFDSDTYMLFEIKLKLDNETDKSKLYHWLLYDKNSYIIKKLDFISMSEKERVFTQGILKFDDIYATLFLDNEELKFNTLPNSDELNNIFINILAKILKKISL